MIEYLPLITLSGYLLYVVVSELYDDISDIASDISSELYSPTRK